MNFKDKLCSKNSNLHYLNRYIRLIEKWKDQTFESNFDRHHILPKASDFFPEYKNLKRHKWNQLNVSKRQHFILHMILSKAFPKSSQNIAFYHMCNFLQKNTSREYERCLIYHKENLNKLHKNLIRNEKISSSLRGKSKSKEHINKMKGHIVSESTREKLRNFNLGKIRTQESIDKQIKSRKEKGIARSFNENQKDEMSKIKLSQNLRWYTNGKIAKMFPFGKCPYENWFLGRKITHSSSHTN